MTRSDPIKLSEARSIIVKAIANPNILLVGFSRTLQILEAVVGPSDVAEIIVTSLEALSDEILSSSNATALFARHLGFSLLRVPASEATVLERRLEKLRRRVPEFSRRSAREALEMIAGRAQRSADDGVFLLEGAREKILKLVAGDPNPKIVPNARLVFLAGDELVNWYAKNAKKLDPYRQPDLIAQFSPMRSERALSFMLLLAATSKVKKEALSWFIDHSDRTRPFLEKTSASKGDEGTWAKAVLAKLPIV